MWRGHCGSEQRSGQVERASMGGVQEWGLSGGGEHLQAGEVRGLQAHME